MLMTDVLLVPGGLRSCGVPRMQRCVLHRVAPARGPRSGLPVRKRFRDDTGPPGDALGRSTGLEWLKLSCDLSPDYLAAFPMSTAPG